jgi:hypothetical protein
MDFSAWYEVFLDGRWFSFDARHNHPRIGRIVIARGRDAADVAISTAFGPDQLVRLKVITDELLLRNRRSTGRAGSWSAMTICRPAASSCRSRIVAPKSSRRCAR